MATVIVDFTVCCERDKVFFSEALRGKPFALEVVRELALAVGRPVDVALCSREDTCRQLADECGCVLSSKAEPGTVRSWKEVVADLARHDLPAGLGEDDLLVVMPLRGLVSSSRTGLFLDCLNPGRVTVSTRVTQVNKNPFWNYAIYPEFTEQNLIRDVNITKLPRLCEKHFTEENRRLIPVGKLNGSHDLPVVYDRYDAYAHIPAGIVAALLGGEDVRPRIVKLDKGDSRPHLLYMLPVLNFHADCRVVL